MAGVSSSPILPADVSVRLDGRHHQYDSASANTTPYIYMRSLGLTTGMLPSGSTINGVEIVINLSSNFSGNRLIFDDGAGQTRPPYIIAEPPVGGPS